MSASATIIEFVSQDRVDAAWNALCAHRVKLFDNSLLIADRRWVEEDARLHARFVQLFMASEPPCEVVALERAS